MTHYLKIDYNLYFTDLYNMAASRSRRSNAGNKMASLLDSEEVDDFYTTTYGGFSEEAEDKEYIIEPTENKRQRYL